MTKETDIVKRLRELENLINPGSLAAVRQGRTFPSVLTQAADEIERLRKVEEKLNEQIEDLYWYD